MQGERTTINGLDAFVGSYEGQIEGLGDVASRAAHIAHGGVYYMVAGLVAPDGFRLRPMARFTTAIRSFRPLTAAEAEAIRPYRVDFYIVRDGDTWASIAERSGGAIKPTTLAVMNQTAPDVAAACRRANQDRGGRMKALASPIQRALRIAAGVGAIAFGVISYVYLTLPDVRPLATSNPAHHGVHGAARARGRARRAEPVKRVHRWVPYSRISINLRRAVLAAEDSAFFDHEGIDVAEIKKSIQTSIEQGSVAARRQHDHAAAGEEPVSVAVARSAAQAP